MYNDRTQSHNWDKTVTTSLRTTEGILVPISSVLCNGDCSIEVETEEKEVKLKEAKEKLAQLDTRVEVMYV